MSNTRALVSCTILSLQDSCFVYPCCKGCLSRLIQESKRAICGRCGFACDLQNVDYRYRLSFKVSRNQDIFGVTVFGGCLNPFFGITAGGLQRCIDLEKTEGTHTVEQLLVKAVEDCFIGRCVIFGLKVPHKVATSSLSGHLVACQIISPCESLMGCTVIGYFKNLLRANSHSANSTCPSQQKDSQSSQRNELNSFDYTPPSCAKLDSQPSNEGFTLSSAWQSPGLCFPPEELSNDLLQQSRDCDRNISSPKNEEIRTCKCTCQSNTSQLKYVSCIQDELKNETQNIHRKSFSTSCDMFESSAHFNSSTACDTVNPLSTLSCGNNTEITKSGQLVRAKIGEEYNAPLHEKSLYSLDLEDAPLSESLQDFVSVEPQISEIIDTKEHSKSDQMIQVQNRCSLTENSAVTRISKTIPVTLCSETLSSPMRNVNNTSWKENNENDFPENLETKMNNAEIHKTPTVLCTTSSSKKLITFSPDITCAFNRSTNNRLSFSNKKELTLKRKKSTRSRASVAFCSVNHEKGKYFRHCAQSEVHSVNCKVRQERIVFDDHEEKYNCSVDLFASGESSMDMNLSDVTEICKVNEPRNVNTSEPGGSGSLPFSPCLQSTPVSYYNNSCGQKTRRSQKRVGSLCSGKIKCEFKSKIIDLKLSDKRQKVDQLPIIGSTESFSSKSDMQDASCNLSINEWSKDLFENSF